MHSHIVQSFFLLPRTIPHLFFSAQIFCFCPSILFFLPKNAIRLPQSWRQILFRTGNLDCRPMFMDRSPGKMSVCLSVSLSFCLSVCVRRLPYGPNQPMNHRLPNDGLLKMRKRKKKERKSPLLSWQTSELRKKFFLQFLFEHFISFHSPLFSFK